MLHLLLLMRCRGPFVPLLLHRGRPALFFLLHLVIINYSHSLAGSLRLLHNRRQLVGHATRVGDSTNL